MQRLDNLCPSLNVEQLGEYLYLKIGTKWALVLIVGIQMQNYPNRSPKNPCFWKEPSRGFKISPQNHHKASPKHPIFYKEIFRQCGRGSHILRDVSFRIGIFPLQSPRTGKYRGCIPEVGTIPPMKHHPQCIIYMIHYKLIYESDTLTYELMTKCKLTYISTK